jgi:hypothetical protein
MTHFGKKILSAFVEVTAEKPVTTAEVIETRSNTYAATAGTVAAGSEKFTQYFDQLFKDANLPGPDYFEFSKMTEAMMGIPDERARYSAAFAGLSVQGLDKQKLLNTAAQYIQVVETDADNFSNTVDAALKEKVQTKQQEIADNVRRIQMLTKEISELQNKITVLQNEVKENEEKIESSSGGYKVASEIMKQRILSDIEKIKQYIT